MRPVFTHPPGISAALYAAALAATAAAEAQRDAALAKLVDSTEIDLTAAIVAACAAAPASDPGSQAGTLTATASTGTFDGVTVPCVQLGYTTTAATRDGHGEAMLFDLGTIASHFPAYNPALHEVALVLDLVAVGTLNSARPIVAILDSAAGTPAVGGAYGAGWHITSSTQIAATDFIASTSGATLSTVNPTTAVARTVLRRRPTGTTTASYVQVHTVKAAASNGADARVTTLAYTAGTDKVHLMLGQSNATAGAISGLKARARLVLLPIANINLADAVMGCET